MRERKSMSVQSKRAQDVEIDRSREVYLYSETSCEHNSLSLKH